MDIIPEGGRYRFTLEMPTETVDLLDRLAALDNSTRGQVLGKALALFETAVHAVVQGKKIVIAENYYDVVGEIVGLIPFEQPPAKGG